MLCKNAVAYKVTFLSEVPVFVVLEAYWLIALVKKSLCVSVCVCVCARRVEGVKQLTLFKKQRH